MKQSTVASLNKRDGGVTILPPSEFSNQASSKMQIVFPFPILHLEPRAIKFLDFRILFQANDPDEELALKMEQFGKYFSLKTR